jgi:hypothetical protein
VHASELLQGILRDAAAAPELKRDSERKLAELTPRIPRLKLSVEPDLASAGIVSVDGNEWPRAVWDVASPIDPGAHVASCRNGQGELARVDVVLGEGETRDVLLSSESGVADGTARGPGAPGEDRGPRRLYKSWVLWTAVGVAVVGGAIALAVTSGKDEQRPGPVAEGNTGAGVIRW